MERLGGRLIAPTGAEEALEGLDEIGVTSRVMVLERLDQGRSKRVEQTIVLQADEKRVGGDRVMSEVAGIATTLGEAAGVSRLDHATADVLYAGGEPAGAHECLTSQRRGCITDECEQVAVGIDLDEHQKMCRLDGKRRGCTAILKVGVQCAQRRLGLLAGTAQGTEAARRIQSQRLQPRGHGGQLGFAGRDEVEQLTGEASLALGHRPRPLQLDGDERQRLVDDRPVGDRQLPPAVATTSAASLDAIGAVNTVSSPMSTMGRDATIAASTASASALAIPPAPPSASTPWPR